MLLIPCRPYARQPPRSWRDVPACRPSYLSGYVHTVWYLPQSTSSRTWQDIASDLAQTCQVRHLIDLPQAPPQLIHMRTCVHASSIMSHFQTGVYKARWDSWSLSLLCRGLPHRRAGGVSISPRVSRATAGVLGFELDWGVGTKF